MILGASGRGTSQPGRGGTTESVAALTMHDVSYAGRLRGPYCRRVVLVCTVWALMLPRVSAKWAYLQHMLLWYEMKPQAARSSNLCSLASRHNMLRGTQEVLPGFDKRRLHADRSGHVSNPKSAVCFLQSIQAHGACNRQ